MDINLRIDRIAVHFVAKRENKIEIGKSEQNVRELNPVVIEFLLKLVQDIWKAGDRGNINSAKFSINGSKVAADNIKKIKIDGNNLYESSVQLARHLYEQTPGNASTGLLGVLRFVQISDGSVYVALLKIQVKNEKFVKLPKATLTQITVEDVENLLLEKIQKGAIYPHPLKRNFDLKVVDLQSKEDPAIYFSEKFLGCKPKKSDEHQVIKLVPELQRFAIKSGLPFAVEKVPKLLISLKDQNRDITTPLLTRIVKENEIYGSEFDSEKFENYIIEKSDLGEVDIPREQFALRGVGRKIISRKLTYSFESDPKLKGLELTSPMEIIDKIMTIEDDTVTFNIKTTKNGFKSSYE